MKLSWNENIWFSPKYGISNFSVIKEHEGEPATRNNKYRKEREAWIMGVSLLGVNKLTGNMWWLQVPKEDPPDMLCMWVDVNKPLNILNWREVEIMQITRYSKGSIKNEVMRKLSNKKYPKEYALLIYLQRDEEIPNLELLSNDIREIKPEISDIWCLGHTHPTKDNFILFSLYPKFQRVDFNVIEEVRNLLPGDYITMTRSTNKEFTRLNTYIEYEIIPKKK